MEDKRVVAEFSYVDPSKVGKRLPANVTVPAKQTKYSASPSASSTPPPVNPELFSSSSSSVDEGYRSPIPPPQNTKLKDSKGEPLYPELKSKTSSSSSATKQQSSEWIFVGAIVVVVVLLLVWVFSGHSPYDGVASLTLLSWETKLRVEEFKPNMKEDWNLPSNTQLDRIEKRIHHYIDINEGYVEKCYEKETKTPFQEYVRTDVKCLNDGSCTQQDVYETKEEVKKEVVCKQEPVVSQEPFWMDYYFYWQWDWNRLPDLVSSGINSMPRWSDFMEDSNHRIVERQQKLKAKFEGQHGEVVELDLASFADFEYYLKRLHGQFHISRDRSGHVTVN